ncbi:hypothetical protein BD414DRAFT_319905 [Trametes punicea]|nr:hypothetical protein BD414DRAFT_319905 [Trametes punicea]
MAYVYCVDLEVRWLEPAIDQPREFLKSAHVDVISPSTRTGWLQSGMPPRDDYLWTSMVAACLLITRGRHASLRISQIAVPWRRCGSSRELDEESFHSLHSAYISEPVPVISNNLGKRIDFMLSVGFSNMPPCRPFSAIPPMTIGMIPQGRDCLGLLFSTPTGRHWPGLAPSHCLLILATVWQVPPGCLGSTLQPRSRH